MGVEVNLLATTIRGVIAQRLIRKNCLHCKKAYQPEAFLLKEFAIPSDVLIEFIRGDGCSECNYTGFAGRVPIVELWLPTKEELLMLNTKPDNIVLRQKVFGDMKRRTLIEDGLRRVFKGETSLEELLRVVPSEQVNEAATSIDWQQLVHSAVASF
jgi:type II secretory ATPase GspE/PulE/Tfp pilus assembly ATPase PilB-like protein